MSEKQIMQVAIVDYEAGNLFSVEQACKTVGLNLLITNKPEEILNADALILPGVGAFGDAMKNLHKLGLVKTLREFAASGKPFMGICLGMQLLFSESDEFGHHKGLDIINGRVVKFIPQKNKRIKVPQIAWNQISRAPSISDSYWNASPLRAIRNGEFMYFVHSFYAIPDSKENLLTVTNYASIEYASGVIQRNIWGFQFHPEKSGAEGLKIYKNFKDITDRRDCNG